MRWYYYEPLSYSRHFIVFGEGDLKIIEIDYDGKNTIIDFDYYHQNEIFLNNKDLKTPFASDKKKILKLLENHSHRLIRKIFTYQRS